MSVEILSVSLTDESINAIADAVAARLGQGQWPTTQSNPGSSQNPQGAAGPGSQGQGDPWMNGNGGQQNQGYQGQPNNGQQYQQGPQQGQGQQFQGQQGQGQQGGHNCAHGAMQWQPPGTNRNTGEQYSGYWKCPLPRGAQGRCRNQYN